MPSSTPLPPKENALFKRILKCYEQKQYKNGLKFAKAILTNPKFSEHGETLAMKGLTLNFMGRKEEAYDHVRRGLRNDLRSHICWHVFGLLQRSDRKYDEAIKAYRNALKWDQDNIQILRDLSLLQIQIRDYEGYKETRYQLLKLRPTQRGSWIGYAMAFHVQGNHEMALKIIEEFRKTQEPSVRPFDYEYSELLLYQNLVIREAGKPQEALDHLANYEKQIVDKLVMQETRAELMLSLEKSEEAATAYTDLISRNPENEAYYTGLEKARQPASPEDRFALYTEAQKSYPRARTPKCLPLSFLTGDAFRQQVEPYLRASLHKGVPNLFRSLKQLYCDREKVAIIEKVMLEYVESLKTRRKFREEDDESEEQAPTALLWCYYFLAQHYDVLNQQETALRYIETCMEHTPTFIEAYSVKGKIYKHAGDVFEAARCLDEAQALDTADRYINCVCARYLLHADLVREAEDMCSKFTREGVSAAESLNEMQCMWFQTESALAFQRLGNFGNALKKCHEVDRHFTEIIEDQFDFHTYCLRKMTLCSYVSLLRLEDNLRSHPFYFKAAKTAIEIYLHLHDHPVNDDDEFSMLNSENMSPSEIKKQKNKLRKKQKKEQMERERQQVEAAKREHKKGDKDAETEKPKDQELLPEKLAKPESALEEAVRFLKPLQIHASSRLETHCLAFEIYWKKDKLLLMLQSVKRAWSIDKNDEHLHTCRVRLLQKVRSTAEVSDTVKQVLERELPGVYGDCRDPVALNNAFLAQHRDSLPHTIAVARMMYFLEPSRQAEAVALLSELSPDMQGFGLAACQLALTTLTNGLLGDSEAAAEALKTKCHELLPLSPSFWPPDHPGRAGQGPTPAAEGGPEGGVEGGEEDEGKAQECQAVNGGGGEE